MPDQSKSTLERHCDALAKALEPVGQAAQIKRMQDFLCERGLFREYMVWMESSVTEAENTTDPHPCYPGGCDANGPFETCSECNKVIKPAFTVEKDDARACRECGHGTYWEVIGPGDLALGRSFGNPHEAEWMAELLSLAYEAGRRTSQNA